MNDRFFCEKIKKTVTPAICDFRIADGFCYPDCKENIKKEDAIMPRGKPVDSKICKRCGNDYKPTSNAQKYCDNCLAIVIQERNDRYRREKGMKPRKETNSGVAERSRRKSHKLKDAGSTPAPATIMPPLDLNLGKEIWQELGGNNSYLIQIDFTPYPKLHEKLIKLSIEKIRSPGDQLLFLLRNELSDMEGKA